MKLETNYNISQIVAPLDSAEVWEVESFLLKIFEYGDYSFRSVLYGEYSATLDSVFFLAKEQGEILGAAGCLYSIKHPSIAIVGPVGVNRKYRSNGIGTTLVKSIIQHLQQKNCIAAYLGVSKDNPAISLYSKLGFKQYQGIVRQLLFCKEGEFERSYFDRKNVTKIRRTNWGDYPAVSALLAYPCSMYSFNLRRGIFSSKYIETSRFLPVFPEMMSIFTKYGGFANTLLAFPNENVVGLAYIVKLPSDAEKHIAELDFYVHDNFIDYTKMLLLSVLNESILKSIHKVNCYCLSCDQIKREIIESVGGKRIAILPQNVFLRGVYVDVFIYEIKGKT